MMGACWQVWVDADSLRDTFMLEGATLQELITSTPKRCNLHDLRDTCTIQLDPRPDRLPSEKFKACASHAD